MAFDPLTIAPEARAHYIRIGKRFGSDDTLAQADKTLAALRDYGDSVARTGFGSGQASILTDVRDELSAASVHRLEARADKKVTDAALLDAMRDGKTARFTVRAALSAARFQLFNAGDQASVNDIDAVLDRTSSAGADAAKLASQLEALDEVAQEAPVAAALGDQAADLHTQLQARVDALHTARAEKAAPHGTPAATEDLDLLDGLIVTLVRTARKAARAAARLEGTPAIAKSFELDQLYKTSRGHA